jgi:hypothetical protein
MSIDGIKIVIDIHNDIFHYCQALACKGSKGKAPIYGKIDAIPA